MKKILQLNNSLFGNEGKSSVLTNAFVEKLRAKNPEAGVISRDLAVDIIPHLSFDSFTASNAPQAERTSEQSQAASLADTLIQELMDSDVLVIGSPTYNFSLPSSLKAWFDHVARAGTTFQYGEKGPEGLVDAKAYVFITSGGQYKGTDADFQTHYIQHILEFLGITDVTFTYLEGVAMGDDVLDTNMLAAQERIVKLVEQIH